MRVLGTILMLRDLMRRFLGDTSGEMLRSTAKAAAVTAVFSVSVAYYLSDKLDNDRAGLERLVFNLGQDNAATRTAARAGVDMQTTGSLRNQTVRLDPCEVPKR